MTGEFTFASAGPADDADLRRLLASTLMPGPITVTFEREPDYFRGCPTMGPRCDVLVARHRATGRLAGVMCRSIRRVFVNGRECEVGTIGQVRVAAEFRGRHLLERGLPLFVERSRPELPNCGVMAAGNAPARRAMVDHPPEGFVVRDVEDLLTVGIIVRRPKRVVRGRSRATPATEADLPDLVKFLSRFGRSRQYFPAYRIGHFGPGGIMPDLAVSDLFVVRGRGGIVGAMGIWDQSGFKQTVVRAYRPGLRAVRPVFGAVAGLVGAKPLPGIGEHIRAAYACCVCVADDDPTVMRTLLRAVYSEASRRGFAYLLVGLSERDPLLKVARRYAHITYRASFQASAYRPGVIGHDLYPELDGRPVYVEIASL